MCEPCCRPIGVSSTETLTITNYGKSEEIIIVLAPTDTPRLEVNFGQSFPIRINPGNSIKLQVSHTAAVYGNTTSYLLLKLSTSKCYIYKVKAYGIDNSYDIRPIRMTVYRPGAINVIPVEIRNPSMYHSLVLYCVKVPDKEVEVQYNTEFPNFEPTCCPCKPFLTIPPLKKMRAFNLVFTLHTTAYMYFSLRINAMPSLEIVIPVIIRTSFGTAQVVPHALNFGIVTPDSKPHRLKVRLNTTAGAVTINGILSSRTAPNFLLQFPMLIQHPIVIPQSARLTTLGYVAFYADTPGIYEGHMYIHTNASEAVKLDLRAEVANRPLEFAVADVGIDATKKTMDRTYVHTLWVENALHDALVFSQMAVGIKNARAEILCLPSTGGQSPMKCAKSLAPGTRDSVAQIRYWSVSEKGLPLTTYVTMLTANTLYHVPLLFFDSNPTCAYYDYPPYLVRPMAVRRKCSEVGSIDLGIFADEAKTFVLNITNLSPVNITLTRLALQHRTTFTCFELSGIYDVATGERRKEYTMGKLHSLTDGEEVAVPSNSLVMVKLYQSLDDCSVSGTMKIVEGNTFTNVLFIRTEHDEARISLQSWYHSGEFSFSPSRMRFEPGFAGTRQRKELRAISTFKIPLNILKTWSTDKRVELSLSLRQVKGESKTEIGIVSFVPGNTPEEQYFLSLQNSILSWGRSAVSLRELKLWRERQTMWDRISNIGGTVIDAQIYIDTDVLQRVRLPVKAELTQPILVQENEVNFKLIQNGSSKAMSIQIYNPATEPLIIQLFAADPAIANYKSTLPLYFTGSTQCRGNYTLWLRKYAVTIRQLRRQEKLTEYRTFEEFASEYCCYTGEHNSSTLYHTKLDETQIGFGEGRSTETDMVRVLARFCDSKEVASFSAEPPWSGDDLPGIKDSVSEGARAKPIMSVLWNFFFHPTEKKQNATRPQPVTSGCFSFPSTFSQYPLIVDALSYFTVGPIAYNPQSIGEHTATIFIKNNLTILYPLKLKGESGVGTLEFVQEVNRGTKGRKSISVFPKEHISLRKAAHLTSEIEMRLSRNDLLVPSRGEGEENISNLWSLIVHYLSKLDNYEYKVRTGHERVFVLRNSGNMPLTVIGIIIDDRGCSGYGVNIRNCKGFTLQPEETHKLVIEYTTRLAVASSRHTITFFTLSGSQTFDLSIHLPFALLYALQRMPSIESYPLRDRTLCRPGEVQLRICISGVMLLMTFVIAVLSVQELFYDPNSKAKALLMDSVELAKKEMASNYIATATSLAKTLSDIELVRNSFLMPSQASRKKSSVKELCDRDRKKLVKRARRKRSDPTDQKNKAKFVPTEPQPRPQNVQLELPSVQALLSPVPVPQPVSTEPAESQKPAPEIKREIVPATVETPSPPPEKEASSKNNQAGDMQVPPQEAQSNVQEVEGSLKPEAEKATAMATGKVESAPEGEKTAETGRVAKDGEMPEAKVEVVDKKIETALPPVPEEKKTVPPPEPAAVVETAKQEAAPEAKKPERGPSPAQEKLPLQPVAETTKPVPPQEIPPVAQPSTPEPKEEKPAEKTPPKSEPAQKPDDAAKPGYGAKGYPPQSTDYREQYRAYQQNATKFVKRPMKHYGHKHTTMYLKKSPNPSPVHKVEATEQQQQKTKQPEELAPDESNVKSGVVATPAKSEAVPTPERKSDENVVVQPASVSNTPLKEVIEERKEESGGNAEAFRNIMAGLNVDTESKEGSEQPLEGTEHLQKARTCSIMSEEGLRRKGLGGITYKLSDVSDDTSSLPQEPEWKREPELELTEEGSEKGTAKAEQEFYKCYNPLANLELKLPTPFTIKEERHEEENQEEETKAWASYADKEKEDVSLFEAYRSANMLLGDRTYFTESRPIVNKPTEISPLSELRGDSVEYIPKTQRRPVTAFGEKKEAKRIQPHQF